MAYSIKDLEKMGILTSEISIAKNLLLGDDCSNCSYVDNWDDLYYCRHHHMMVVPTKDVCQNHIKGRKS